MKNFVKEKELLFKKRKEELYQALSPHIIHNKEALLLFNSIKNISVKGMEITYPLTNEYCERLIKCTSEQEIVSILIEIIDIQNQHDFLHFKNLVENLEFEKMDIFNYLRLATSSLNELEPNPYQPDLDLLLKQIKSKRKETIAIYDEAIVKIERWVKKNDKKTSL